MLTERSTPIGPPTAQILLLCFSLSLSLSLSFTEFFLFLLLLLLLLLLLFLTWRRESRRRDRIDVRRPLNERRSASCYRVFLPSFFFVLFLFCFFFASRKLGRHRIDGRWPSKDCLLFASLPSLFSFFFVFFLLFSPFFLPSFFFALFLFASLAFAVCHIEKTHTDRIDISRKVYRVFLPSFWKRLWLSTEFFFTEFFFRPIEKTRKKRSDR